jgi:hypothetical protein
VRQWHPSLGTSTDEAIRVPIQIVALHQPKHCKGCTSRPAPQLVHWRMILSPRRNLRSTAKSRLRSVMCSRLAHILQVKRVLRLLKNHALQQRCWESASVQASPVVYRRLAVEYAIRLCEPFVMARNFMPRLARFHGAFAIAGTTFGFISNAIAQNIQLGIPIACELGRTCYIQNYVDTDPSPSANDYKCGTLTYDRHNGTDFRLPSLEAQKAGVEVLASASGRVLRTRDGALDGVFRKSEREAVRDVECGNGVVIEHAEHWETQYCHLANGSLQVKPGDLVKGGQPLGRVGLSGLTEYPHLHFTVSHQSIIADPFAYGAAPDSCGGGEFLWDPSLHTQLAYQERTILNAGFTSGAVTMDVIEDGKADRELPSADAPTIVAFVRTIGLKVGDVQWFSLRDPAGHIIAENRAAPLENNKAQVMLFAGRKRPASGWDQGTYKAMYVVKRDGQVVLKRDLELTF